MNSPLQQDTDKHWMQLALALAEQAHRLNEVPVGAVVVRDGVKLGEGHNRSLCDSDPSAHAEIQALRQAALAAGSFRLDGATLYVTLEPCLMCCGALLQARISRLVFGAREPRLGAVVSAYDTLMTQGQTQPIAIEEGVLAEQSSRLLRGYFAEKR